MRLSCSNYGYRQQRLAEVIPSIAKIGYTGIEIVTHGLGWPMGYHLTPEFEEAGYIKALNECLIQNEVQVTCISPSNNFWEPKSGKLIDRGSIEDQIKHVNRQVDLAIEVNAPLLRIHAATVKDIPDGVSRSTFIKKLAEPLAICADYAKSQGKKLAIETHGGYWAAVPENVMDLLNAVGSDNLGIVLHTYIGCEKDVPKLGKKIWHLHLSEASKTGMITWRISAMRRTGAPYSQIKKELGLTKAEFEEALAFKADHLYLGEGDINWKAVFKALIEIGYSGWWNFEGHWTGDPEADARKGYIYICELLSEIS